MSLRKYAASYFYGFFRYIRSSLKYRIFTTCCYFKYKKMAYYSPKNALFTLKTLANIWVVTYFKIAFLSHAC